jgi:hypothetical protein
MVRRRAWGGPGKGTRAIRGEDWLPYQPPSVVTPPFAEYVSGHSIFSAAAAEVLASFTGSRRYGGITSRPAIWTGAGWAAASAPTPGPRPAATSAARPHPDEFGPIAVAGQRMILRR